MSNTNGKTAVQSNKGWAKQSNNENLKKRKIIRKKSMIHFKTFVFVQYHKNEYKYILFLALSSFFFKHRSQLRVTVLQLWTYWSSTIKSSFTRLQLRTGSWRTSRNQTLTAVLNLWAYLVHDHQQPNQTITNLRTGIKFLADCLV